MNISHLISTPNLFLDKNAFLEDLRHNWLNKEFNYIFDNFEKNSDGTYTVFASNYMHDNVSFDPEPIRLKCNKEQNTIMAAFDTLKELSL